MTRLEKIDEQIMETKAKLKDPNLAAGTAETWTRISGYFRPISAWNDGKQQEFTERTEYDWKEANK